MQDFRHLNTTNNNDLPDTTALVQTELQQLQTALRSAQRQIKWQVHQPLSSVEIEKRIKMLKISNGISTVIKALFVGYIYFNYFVEPLINFLFLVICAEILIGITYWVQVWIPRRMRRNNITTTSIVLNLDKQKVVINEGNKKRLLKFHSNKPLPTFILPANANADLCHLRDDVQNRITQITGLTFT